LGVDYPPPVVDPATSARRARERVWMVRQGAAFHAEADAIQDRHGSRKSGLGSTARPARIVPKAQVALRFDPLD
jgi:deoxyribodipyrimidine photo-lyase